MPGTGADGGEGGDGDDDVQHVVSRDLDIIITLEVEGGELVLTFCSKYWRQSLERLDT